MAYRIYHTEAIVLQSKPVGDGDVLLFLYTRDLGLVMASAKSLRLGKSRLRFALQRFAHAHIDLVRAKNGWRLTSARTIATNSELYLHPHRKVALAALSAVLLRLIHGESPHPELYVLILRSIAELAMLETREDCAAYELLVVIRFLHVLGYWEIASTDAPYFDLALPWSAIRGNLVTNRRILVPRVNEALRATNL